MLETVYYGNTLHNWGISLLIVIGALIVNKLFMMFSKHLLERRTRKSKMRYDILFLKALEKPVLLGIILVAIWIAGNRLNLGAKVHEIIAKSYGVLIILNITWFIARFSEALVEEEALKSKKRYDNNLIPLIKRGVLILIWTLGIITALKNIGIEVTTLLGTLGIGGIALALAAQDTIKNIFGGITILTDRTFHIGDIIRFEDIEGTVEDIGLRTTRIRTYERRLAFIPNYKLTDSSVVNVSHEPGRRVLIKLGLTYDTDHHRMQEAIDILHKIPEIVADVNAKDFEATFSDFGDSSLMITLIYFIRKHADIRATISQVNFEILRSFNEAGLNFAFPTQTIHLEQ